LQQAADLAGLFYSKKITQYFIEANMLLKLKYQLNLTWETRLLPERSVGSGEASSRRVERCVIGCADFFQFPSADFFPFPFADFLVKIIVFAFIDRFTISKN
jgi:adenine-specific DNA methylase